jgi:hypothetical protein
MIPSRRLFLLFMLDNILEPRWLPKSARTTAAQQ